MKRIKTLLIGIAFGIAVAGLSAVAANNVPWTLATNGGGYSVITPGVNIPLAFPMSQPFLSSATATTTSGTLATSTIVTYNFSNVASGALATSSVALKYYFEVSAVDSTKGITTPGNEMSANVSSTNANNEVVLTWTPVTAASSYTLYVGTSTGGEALSTSTTATSFTVSTTTGLLAAVTPSVNTAYVSTISPNGNAAFGGSLKTSGNLIMDATATSMVMQGTGTSTCYALTLTSTGTVKTATTTCL